jgi:hypothetical protein
VVVRKAFGDFGWKIQLAETLEGLVRALDIEHMALAVVTLVEGVLMLSRGIVGEPEPLFEIPVVSAQTLEILVGLHSGICGGIYIVASHMA